MDANIEPKKPVSDWKSKGLRVGWTVRMNNGKLAIVTWVNPTDQRSFMAKPIKDGLQ